MYNSVQEYTLSILPVKRKQTQGGWLSFNAVCCPNNGENKDTRGRGGVIVNTNGAISYACFNCNFKTSYAPGRQLSFKYRKLLKWLGADANEVQRLVIEALRVKDLIQPEHIQAPAEEVEYDPHPLPKEARSFNELLTFHELNNWQNVPPAFHDAVNCIYRRKINMQKYDFYLTSEVEHKLSHRIIIPFIYKQNIIGYTARAINDNIKPKYYSDYPPNVVFNLDQQTYDRKFVIVCEGPFDAMSIDGISVQTNDISDAQADLIQALDREIIVVPDWDKPGKQLIDKAIEFGWHVSFPVWRETCKDISEAVVKYGKLFVLKAILSARESNSLKIKLMANKI